MIGLPLLLIPAAGCGAAEFRPLVHALPTSVYPFTVELPGRGKRWREPLVSSSNDAVDAIRAAIPNWPVFAVLGESLGAYIGLKLIEQVTETGVQCPVLFAVSNSPIIARGDLVLDAGGGIDEDSTLRLISEMGGKVPAEILAHDVIRRRFLEVARHDLLVSQSFISTAKRSMIDSDVVVVAGTEDRTLTDLERWQEHTRGNLRVISLPGGHLQCRENPGAIATLVETQVGTCHG